MGAAEEREELKRIAAQVMEEVKNLRGSVNSFTKRLDIVINHLLSDADSLALAAADEKSGHVKVQRMTYDKVTLLPTPAPEPEPLAPGKRACSICRQPGHRAKNCPNAHEVQQAKREQVEARDKAKKKRRPK